MIYRNENVFMKELPVLQDGDELVGGNWSRRVQEEISADIIIKANPNMHNCNLTGNYTAETGFLNDQVDHCYWENKKMKLEELPTYSGEGATCGPDVSNCRHVNPDLVENVTIDGETETIYDNARKDIEL